MTIKNIIRNVTTEIYCNFFLQLLKVNREKIVFIITQSHSDNCMALIQYLLSNNCKSDICILVDGSIYNKYCNIFNDKPVRVISGTHNFIRYNYELLTAKYVFFMHRRPFSNIKKKNGQIIVNLWHGSGYKNVADNEAPWRDGIDFDYVLVPGPIFVDAKAKFFSCNRDRVLPIGYPRYDVLKHRHKNAQYYIENKLNAKEKKVIIWLPTYRQKEESFADSSESKIVYKCDMPLIQSMDELDEIDKLCSNNNIVILVKRHPYQKRYQCENRKYTNIFFCDNTDLENSGITLYELLTETDALISDYSSVAVDYMLLDKPMAFCLDDFEQYKATRGFVFENPLEYMPGYHLKVIDDLIGYIKIVSDGVDIFKYKRARIMSEMHNPCYCYCERIWQMLNNH